MSDVMITPGAAKVFRGMVTSCGNAACFETVRLLEQVTEPTLLSKLAFNENGHYRMAAFERLGWFAADEGLEVIDTFDMAHYFGGKLHTEIFERLAHKAGMGSYLGPAVGLVSHVLLPLNQKLRYQNAGQTVEFGGHFVEFNPKEKGVPCYHLGVIVRVPLTEEQVQTLLAEQAASELFVEALKKIKKPIIPPKEYWEALNCTVDRVKKEQRT